MDILDPRSIRKGSKIRLDDTAEGSDAYVGGTVGHVNEAGQVIIDHMGTFVVEGLTTGRTKGYTVYRLTEHTPPKPDPLAELIWFTSRDDGEGVSAILADKVAAAIREKFAVTNLDEVDAEHAPELEWKHQAVLADWLGRRFLAGTNGKGDRRLYGADGSFTVPPAEGLRPLIVLDPAEVDALKLAEAIHNADAEYGREPKNVTRSHYRAQAALAHLGIKAAS